MRWKISIEGSDEITRGHRFEFEIEKCLDDLSAGSLGLSIKEGKGVMASLQRHIVEQGKCTRPGVRAAHAVMNSSGGLREIELAVFFFEHGALGCLRFILRDADKRSRFQRGYRTPERFRAEHRHALK